MIKPNLTKFEITQAIEFHLRLDKKQGKTDKSSWPPWLKEYYEKGGARDVNI